MCGCVAPGLRGVVVLAQIPLELLVAEQEARTVLLPIGLILIAYLSVRHADRYQAHGIWPLEALIRNKGRLWLFTLLGVRFQILKWVLKMIMAFSFFMCFSLFMFSSRLCLLLAAFGALAFVPCTRNLLLALFFWNWSLRIC